MRWRRRQSNPARNKLPYQGSRRPSCEWINAPLDPWPDHLDNTTPEARRKRNLLTTTLDHDADRRIETLEAGAGTPVPREERPANSTAFAWRYYVDLPEYPETVETARQFAALVVLRLKREDLK
jgi:hypothetical protein